MQDFDQLIENEKKVLKKYAVLSSETKGRAHSEPHSDAIMAPGSNQNISADQRLPFQKDRDRVMHSRAFRRLKGKTQVFVSDFGDHFRTRLTHSIEVAQISRDIARSLGLNEDLAETIALAHDLGHTPFGHAGQDTLDELMREFGKSHNIPEKHAQFEHNMQSLRIVDKLENIYPHFPGLNLSFEVREGMMKHQTPWDNQGVTITAKPSLEAQIVNLGDEIAYSNHDIDDGLRSGLLTLEGLEKLELFARAKELTIKQYGSNLSHRHLVSRTVSSLISLMIQDVLTYTGSLLQKHNIQTLEDVYALGFPLVDFSSEFKVMNANLKSHLAREMYFSPQVVALSQKGQSIIEKLFHHYTQNKKEFLKEISEENDSTSTEEVAHNSTEITQSLNPNILDSNNVSDTEHLILVKDYIAGMTDEFATLKANSLS